MKTKLTLVLIILLGILFIGCRQKVEVEEVKIDLINDEFPEAKQELMETWDAIVQSLKDGGCICFKK